MLADHSCPMNSNGSWGANNSSAEAARLMSAAAAGEWPPAVVSEWTLEAARTLLPCGTSA